MNRLRIGYAFAGGVLGASALTANLAGIAGGLALIAVVGVAEYALGTSSAPQFADLEHITITSEDAYDYADALPEGQTVVEDKRTAECYVAEYGGDHSGV